MAVLSLQPSSGAVALLIQRADLKSQPPQAPSRALVLAPSSAAPLERGLGVGEVGVRGGGGDVGPLVLVVAEAAPDELLRLLRHRRLRGELHRPRVHNHLLPQDLFLRRQIDGPSGQSPSRLTQASLRSDGRPHWTAATDALEVYSRFRPIVCSKRGYIPAMDQSDWTAVTDQVESTAEMLEGGAC
eukprot:4835676-Pyramimonas_sp.AAC.1